MFFGFTPQTGGATLRNREPSTAPATMTSIIDETLHVSSGSALDLTGWRVTAKPAGSRGRITASGRQLLENGVPVKFNIAHHQPDSVFYPFPATYAEIDAGVQYLARSGYNCIRAMGIEHLVMRGVDGAAVYSAALMDKFDYFLAACKREGLYWVITIQSYNLFMDLDGALSRYAYTTSSTCKARIFTEGDVRQNWKDGVSAFYNRVNPYTGVNILQDPALLMLELYNEASAIFCATTAFPPIWLTRNVGATAAAQTWPEWLQDVSKAHGYANLAALNASWGSAHASYTAAANAALPPLVPGTVPSSQQLIDLFLYLQFLENDLHTFYVSALTEFGYSGLRSMHCVYSQAGEIREAQKLAANDVVNMHHYANLINDPVAYLPSQNVETPLWDYEYPALMHLWTGGTAKPMWYGEGGDIAWGTWRHHWPLVAAAAASHGAVSISFFTQGDFFPTAYTNDATTHGNRFRKLDAFAAPGAYTNDFVRVLLAALFVRGDLAEMTGTLDITFNDRYLGVNPRSTFRAQQYYLAGLYLPLYPAAALAKATLNWSSDTVDDSLALTWLPKNWYTILTELQVSGAIAADHPALVSATTNRGAVTAIATTGTVGGLAASTTQPVLTLSAAHTLVDNDVIHVTNISGTAGTAFRNSRTKVKVGTGNNVRAESGLNLSSYSGYATADWCEGANVLTSGNQLWGMSRRQKCGWINTAKTIYYTCTAGKALPATYGILRVDSLTNNSSVCVVSADGLALASSRKIILGLVGVAENTGMAFTDATRQTPTDMGEYPVKQLDATALLTLGVSNPHEWTLYRLGRNGDRISQESPALITTSPGLQVSLRTGVVQPTVFWELVR